MTNVAPNQRVRIGIMSRTAQLFNDDTLVAERSFDQGDADSKLLDEAVRASAANDTIRTIRLLFPEHLGKF